MDTALVVALVSGSVTAIGWLTTNALSARKERETKRAEAAILHVEHQLQELYGPLVSLLREGRRVFEDLLASLGRNYVFHGEDPLPEHELKTWLFWTENAFLPRNEQIKQLLMKNAHLIEGAEFPESYVEFLDHCNSWAVNHLRWQKEQVRYSWHSRINWPTRFEEDVFRTFGALMAKHARLLGELQDQDYRTSSNIAPGAGKKSRV